VQGHSLRLIVDTGFPGILLYEERLFAVIPGLKLKGSFERVVIGGRVPVKQVVLPEIDLGRKRRDVSVLLLKSPPADLLPNIDGIVGVAPLNLQRISFDFGAIPRPMRSGAEIYP